MEKENDGRSHGYVTNQTAGAACGLFRGKEMRKLVAFASNFWYNESIC
jgi:hypothetical protein